MSKEKHIVSLVPDFLMGSFNESERQTIQSHLNSCPACRREYESLSMLWNALGNLPEEKPSPAMAERFNAMLAAYEQGIRHGESRWSLLQSLNAFFDRFWPKQPAIQFALTLAMLVTGLVVGSRFENRVSAVGGDSAKSDTELAQLRGEVHAMSRMLAVSLLQQQSAGDRIKGVSWTERLVQPDDQIIGALIQTLNYDPTVNVRLAALDALIKFGNRSEIQQTFLESLKKQTSPLVQLALIDVVTELKVLDAVATFNEMLKLAKLNPTVKDRIAERLPQLSR
jgi:anti-sigma factor RsiW